MDKTIEDLIGEKHQLVELMVDIVFEFMRKRPTLAHHHDDAIRSYAADIVGRARRGEEWRYLTTIT